MKAVLAVILSVAAFLLCAYGLAILIGDTDINPPNNFIYHYQALIAGSLAIVAAVVGGWFVRESARYPEEIKKKEFIQEMMDVAIHIHTIAMAAAQSGLYSTMVAGRSDTFADIRAASSGLKLNKIFHLDGEAGRLAKELYSFIVTEQRQPYAKGHEYGAIATQSFDLYERLKGVRDGQAG